MLAVLFCMYCIHPLNVVKQVMNPHIQAIIHMHTSATCPDHTLAVLTTGASQRTWVASDSWYSLTTSPSYLQAKPVQESQLATRR